MNDDFTSCVGRLVGVAIVAGLVYAVVKAIVAAANALVGFVITVGPIAVGALIVAVLVWTSMFVLIGWVLTTRLQTRASQSGVISVGSQGLSIQLDVDERVLQTKSNLAFALAVTAAAIPTSIGFFLIGRHIVQNTELWIGYLIVGVFLCVVGVITAMKFLRPRIDATVRFKLRLEHKIGALRQSVAQATRQIESKYRRVDELAEHLGGGIDLGTYECLEAYLREELQALIQNPNGFMRFAAAKEQELDEIANKLENARVGYDSVGAVIERVAPDILDTNSDTFVAALDALRESLELTALALLQDQDWQAFSERLRKIEATALKRQSQAKRWREEAEEGASDQPDLLSDEEKEQYYLGVLGLDGDISCRDIRDAWAERAKLYHPDKVAALGAKLREVATREMQEINKAREFLEKRHGCQ